MLTVFIDGPGINTLISPADTMPQHPPETVNRRAQFRSLIGLARTATTITYGHTTLHKPSARNQTSTLTRQPQNGLLDAIATILVRDVEVVAIAASGPNIVAIQDAIQEVPGSDADGNRNYSNVRIPKIAAILNQRKEDRYEFPDGGSFVMVKEGRSHLIRSPAEADAWKHYLEIPYVFYTTF
jgi:hypothetical protein